MMAAALDGIEPAARAMVPNMRNADDHLIALVSLAISARRIADALADITSGEATICTRQS